MKRGGPGHPKTLHLAGILQLTRYEAVGVLECLFHWAATYARRGDIGKFQDSEIADGIGWVGDPVQLIKGLVASRWLTICECHRLRIHDWPEHADQGVKQSEPVKKYGFLECYSARKPVAPTYNPVGLDVGGCAATGNGTGKGTGKTVTADGAPKNPLVNRDALIREGHALIAEIATAENLDPTEVVMRASKFKDRSKVRLDTMTDDRLAHTVEDLRVWARKIRGDPEPSRPPSKPALAEDPNVQAFMRGALGGDGDESGVRGRLANPEGGRALNDGRDGPGRVLRLGSKD